GRHGPRRQPPELVPEGRDLGDQRVGEGSLTWRTRTRARCPTARAQLPPLVAGGPQVHESAKEIADGRFHRSARSRRTGPGPYRVRADRLLRVDLRAGWAPGGPGQPP